LDGTKAGFLHEILGFAAVVAQDHGISVEAIEPLIENLAEILTFLSWDCHVDAGLK
jgi:hypothetical protein